MEEDLAWLRSKCHRNMLRVWLCRIRDEEGIRLMLVMVDLDRVRWEGVFAWDSLDVELHQIAYITQDVVSSSLL